MSRLQQGLSRLNSYSRHGNSSNSVLDKKRGIGTILNDD